MTPEAKETAPFPTFDPAVDFSIPKRCFGDDRAAEAFKVFVGARRAPAGNG
ncbi:MAG TPA: hypothetical protein VG758_16860 [Hyphomicrobiaceae bacterium]|jgi:hypothetical protein|nr:hypothetical protein [Hyphomicrobiaceae bacterium]